MRIHECMQGSGEWLRVRAGKVTASSVAAAVSLLKRGERRGAETAARAALKGQIVAELLQAHTVRDHYVSEFMEHGIATEPRARAAYEMERNLLTDTVGFVYHPTIARAGCSPDGLVGEEGLIEIKCPKTETHIAYTFARQLPPEYEPQVMWQLACTGREWCDFVSFDDRLPLRHQMFVHRVFRDEARIAELNAGVEQFLAEVDEMIAGLEELNPEKEPAKRFVQDVHDRGADDMGITDDDIAWIMAKPH